MKQPLIAFAVPRYHQNLIGWVSGLQDCGVSVALLVLRSGPLEDQRAGRVLTVPSRRLRRSRDSDPQSFSVWDVPSPVWMWRWIRLNQPDAVIVRADPGFFSLIATAAALAAGSRPLFYSQKPRRVARQSMLQRAIFETLKVVHRGWLTPVDRLLGAEDYVEVPGKTFIPFAGGMPASKGAEVSDDMDVTTLLAVGKFRPRKRLAELVEAYLALPSEERSHSTLLVAGQCQTSEEIAVYNSIEQIIANLDGGPSCVLLPNVPWADLQLLMSTASAVFVPSIDEPASVTNVEALAKGVPTVVTRSNGTAHYVFDCGGGIVVGTNDEALSEAVRAAIDPQVRDQWKRLAGRSRWQFEPMQAAKQIMRVALPGHPGTSDCN